MIKKIAYRTDYSASLDIEKLDIVLSEQDKENITKAQAILKENKFISSIRIDVLGSVKYLSDEDQKVEDWRVDVEQFIVYSNVFYYYALSKWDASDYIESEDLYLEDFK
jgi:hypothetical protein